MIYRLIMRIAYIQIILVILNFLAHCLTFPYFLKVLKIQGMRHPIFQMLIGRDVKIRENIPTSPCQEQD